MLLTLLIFGLILGIIILAHEFGHFIVAKKCGMKVEEFGIGYPPRLFKYKLRETTYSLNLIPLGGFVKIKGEDGGNHEDPRSFSAKPKWQRALTLVSGVVMNFVLAAVLISIGYNVGIPSVIDETTEGKIRDPKVQIISLSLTFRTASPI